MAVVRACVLLALAGCLAVGMVPALAAGPDNRPAPTADARFDKTGDGWVDAADWGRLTLAERRAYARACLLELGLDPDAGVGEGKTRLDRYLEGLESVYGR